MTSTYHKSEELMVIGSTGKTGKRVVNKLRSLGHQVREGSRHSVTAFDWDQPATWAPALKGIKKAYVTFYPDLAVPAAPEKIECKILFVFTQQRFRSFGEITSL